MLTKGGSTQGSGGGLGIYVHIPFCVKKCAYCDFLSFGGRKHGEHSAYAAALLREIRIKADVYAGRYTVDSVFFGGGTPSCIDAGLLARIMEGLKASFRFAPSCEATIEANPGTVDARKLEAYLRAGINRLSMGVQSTSARTLALLGRIHGRQAFLEAYGLARAAGFKNINFDLMFAVPGQSEGEWAECLEEAISLRPEHISFYSLQIEEGTEIYDRCHAGELAPADEAVDRRMYHRALAILEKNAYFRYEISNACRKGFECRHNLKYWSMQDYLGLGLGAHSFLEGVRIGGIEDLAAYLVAAQEGDYECERHANTESDNISEAMFLGLRRAAGLSGEEFRAATGKGLYETFGAQLEKLAAAGLLEADRPLGAGTGSGDDAGGGSTQPQGRGDARPQGSTQPQGRGDARPQGSTQPQGRDGCAAKGAGRDGAGAGDGDGLRVWLTPKGIDISNTVFLEFM
ncbi:MAG: radical SAM family heme chaperone HemW [Clostridiales Family XIII bacterium]|jgi:oxygen-independent coproporphyrinogen-3 oxidase|nr:radical SAM family heme chaperone HemW [Clostridiales Family XIII bacterium]